MAVSSERRYPVGIQTFSEIREHSYVYIDKTALVYRLAHESGKVFFLSRPRRFGKSLLVSTMQSYFEGRKELFEGLEVASLESDWTSYPVFRIDLSIIKTKSVDELRAGLSEVLQRLERRFGADGATTLGGRLHSLIEHAHEQSGRRVVVLVDEYDAPLLNVIDDPHLLEPVREVMREFFMPLKACDEHLRFVFLTGITKFSQLSIFSELNNLRDISMEPAYAALCGITQDELMGEMRQDIELLAKRMGERADSVAARLKDHFDGYHFCEPSPDIYNPFSLLYALAQGEIGSYWYASGTPTFLLQLISSRGWQLADLQERDVLASEFDVPIEAASSPLAILYQTGYMTIKAYDRESRVYTLGMPNREVEHRLPESLR